MAIPFHPANGSRPSQRSATARFCRRRSASLSANNRTNEFEDLLRQLSLRDRSRYSRSDDSWSVPMARRPCENLASGRGCSFAHDGLIQQHVAVTVIAPANKIEIRHLDIFHAFMKLPRIGVRIVQPVADRRRSLPRRLRWAIPATAGGTTTAANRRRSTVSRISAFVVVPGRPER